jgi:hypothetical protein
VEPLIENHPNVHICPQTKRDGEGGKKKKKLTEKNKKSHQHCSSKDNRKTFSDGWVPSLRAHGDDPLFEGPLECFSSFFSFLFITFK